MFSETAWNIWRHSVVQNTIILHNNARSHTDAVTDLVLLVMRDSGTSTLLTWYDYIQHLLVQNPIILHDNARSHTTTAVMDLLCCWQCESLEHPPYSPDMSSCDYDLFAQVKEPLRGTRYNTREELICVTVRSIRNINKDGRAVGVRRLPNI